HDLATIPPRSAARGPRRRGSRGTGGTEQAALARGLPRGRRPVTLRAGPRLQGLRQRVPDQLQLAAEVADDDTRPQQELGLLDDEQLEQPQADAQGALLSQLADANAFLPIQRLQ